MAETWRQTNNRTKTADKQKIQGDDGGAFIGRINAVNPEQDSMLVEWHGGSRALGILHPFFGISAWHRIAPDPGMGLIMQKRIDNNQVEGMAYHLPQPRDTDTNARIQAFNENKDPFRPIQIGEQDLGSRGLAQIYMGRRPVLDQRAGFVRSWMDGEKGEYGTKAITHRRALHKQNDSEIGDEERFGVVTRPAEKVSGTGALAGIGTNSEALLAGAAGTAEEGTSTATSAAGVDGSTGSGGEMSSIGGNLGSPKSYYKQKIIKDGSSFAREYMYALKSGSTTPKFLVDHREGNVIDDDGNQVLGEFTNSLRFLKRLFTSSDSDMVELQVDDSGNIFLSLGQNATQGIKIDIPAGKWKMKSGTSSSDMTFDGSSGNVTVKSSSEIKIDAESTAKLLAGTVKLGEDNQAIHPLVKTQIYKGSEQSTFLSMGGLGTGEALLSQAAGVGYGAMTGIMTAISAAPLCPGVIVALGNIAQNLVQVILQNAIPQLKNARSALQVVFGTGYDSYLSTTVKSS